jgi:hypothetical protein
LFIGVEGKGLGIIPGESKKEKRKDEFEAVTKIQKC